jgi:hypothetical protein
MESKKYKIMGLFMAILLMGSCNGPITNFSDYMKYLADTENGLVKEKTANGVSLKMKYLPIDYLAYKEYENDRHLSIEDLKKSYENSLTFMMTIGPDKGKNFDITKVDVSSYEEFALRIEEMNFLMKDYLTLTVGDKEIYADLAQMESTYGLEKDRKIVLVFQHKDEQGKSILTGDLTVTYKDEIFYTGINKFKFSMADINAIPEFTF